MAFGGEEKVRCFEGVRCSDSLCARGAWRVCVFRQGVLERLKPYVVAGFDGSDVVATFSSSSRSFSHSQAEGAVPLRGG